MKSQIWIKSKIKNQVLIRHMKIVGIYSPILICTLVVSRLVYMQCVKEGVQEIENYHAIVIYVNEKKLIKFPFDKADLIRKNSQKFHVRKYMMGYMTYPWQP